MTGILHTTLELANRLRAAGHKVTLGCPWDERERVEGAGFPYVQFEEIDFHPTREPRHDPSDSRPRRIWRTLTTARARRQEAVRALSSRRFARTVRDLQADLVLIDVELHEFILTAAHHRLPVVLLRQFFSLTKRSGLPPIGSPLVPAPVGSARWIDLEWAWLRERWRRFVPRKLDQVRSLFTDRRSVLLAYARETGFPRSRLRSYSFLQPFVYRDMPVLTTTDAALDFPHSAEPGVRSVGPMVFTGRATTSEAATVSELETVLGEAERARRKIIYCSVTTAGKGDARFLRRLCDAVARRPEWTVVMGLGRGLDPEDLGPLPDNVSAFAWVPQLDVLARADLSINHGGINTIHECIHFRVPMLIYSGKKHCQDGCAARMTYHGLALSGDKDRDDDAQIEARIDQVFGDPSLRNEVEAAWVRYRGYHDDGTLCRVIDELMDAAKP